MSEHAPNSQVIFDSNVAYYSCIRKDATNPSLILFVLTNFLISITSIVCLFAHTPTDNVILKYARNASVLSAGLCVHYLLDISPIHYQNFFMLKLIISHISVFLMWFIFGISPILNSKQFIEVLPSQFVQTNQTSLFVATKYDNSGVTATREQIVSTLRLRLGSLNNVLCEKEYDIRIKWGRGLLSRWTTSRIRFDEEKCIVLLQPMVSFGSCV
jgi:hypothetical protein